MLGGALLGVPPMEPASQAGALKGEIARVDFRAWSTNHGGVFLNFNGLLAGTAVRDQWTARHGVRFSTTRAGDGNELPPGAPVFASAQYAYNIGRITLVGSKARGAAADTAAEYEIRFLRPQRWVGLSRLWAGATVTRFYDAQGGLLHVARGEGFHGWLADTGETNTWVGRVEITGEEREGMRQVGHTDDLVFGTQPIPRTLDYLSLREVTAGALDSGAKPRLELDYRVRRGISANEGFVLTNATTVTGKLFDSSASTNLGVFLEPE